MSFDPDACVNRIAARITPKRIPSVLYHYTSAQGLLGIIRSRSVWATNIRFMNDSKEYGLALELADGAISERLSAATGACDQGLYHVLRESLEHAQSFEIYVSSFSENGDQLSQWRGYCPGGTGYALGFAAEALRGGTPSVTSRFLAPCVYPIEDQEALVNAVMGALLEFAESGHRHDPDNRDRVYREVFKLFGTLLALVAPVIKHRAFGEEAEWRLVSMASAFPPDALAFRPGRSTLVPYFEHRLIGDEQRLNIQEIIVGPTPHPRLAKHAVDECLQHQGVAQALVRSSRVPYRDW